MGLSRGRGRVCRVWRMGLYDQSQAPASGAPPPNPYLELSRSTCACPDFDEGRVHHDEP